MSVRVYHGGLHGFAFFVVVFVVVVVVTAAATAAVVVVVVVKLQYSCAEVLNELFGYVFFLWGRIKL